VARDFEQIAADHNPFGLSKLGRLVNEWNGHAVGSLVMVTYEGVEEGKLTYFVAAS
jgi:hypothetical protein